MSGLEARRPGSRHGSLLASSRPSVAELAWADFNRDYRGSHLVVAIVAPLRSEKHLRHLRCILVNVIRQARPVSAFSTGIVRAVDCVEVQCGFVQKADADLFARVARARAAPPRAGWASHRSFKLSAARELALAGALAPEGGTR